MCLCQLSPDVPRLLSSQGVRGQTKKGEDIMYDLDSKINFAVFPGLQVCPSSLRTGPTMDTLVVHFMFGRQCSCTCMLGCQVTSFRCCRVAPTTTPSAASRAR